MVSIHLFSHTLSRLCNLDMDVDDASPTESTIAIGDPQGYLRSHLPVLDLTNKGAAPNVRRRWAAASGGFADVWKGTFKRKEIAIKVARVYGSRPLVSAQKVGCNQRFRPLNVISDCIR
jgi:hypothetical protein